MKFWSIPKKMLLLWWIVFSSVYLYAQHQNTCEENFAIYKQFLKINHLEQAYPFWEYMYQTCPDFNRILTKDGIKILKHKYKALPTENERRLIWAKITQLYELLATNTEKSAMVYAQLAFDYVRVLQTDSAYWQALQLLNNRVLNTNDTVALNILVNYQKILFNIIDNQKFSTDLLAQIPAPFYRQVLLFHHRHEAGRALLVNVTQKLKQNNVKIADVFKTDTWIFAPQTTFEQFLNGLIFFEKEHIEPSYFEAPIRESTTLLEPEKNFLLAQLFYVQNNYEQSLAQIAENTNDTLLVDYEKLRIKNLTALKHFEQGLQALDTLMVAYPSDIELYIMKAQIYAQGSYNFTDTFIQKTVYCLAIETLAAAQNISPDNKTIGNLMAYYKKFCPTAEEVFMQSLENNRIYIGLWINRYYQFR